MYCPEKKKLLIVVICPLEITWEDRVEARQTLSLQAIFECFKKRIFITYIILAGRIVIAS
jgi:hypothetical protein